MRNPIARCLSVVLLAAPLFFAACGGDDSSNKNDLAVKQADQSVVVTGDQSVIAGTDVCSTVLLCSLKCSGPDSATCVKTCVSNGTVTAQTQFQAILTCGYTHCIGQTPDGGNEDGGITSCTDASDTSAGCQACVSKEAQSTNCSAEFGACING